MGAKNLKHIDTVYANLQEIPPKPKGEKGRTVLWKPNKSFRGKKYELESKFDKI